MAQEERFGTRDRSYSAWHRAPSTGRFVGIENAQVLSMIDIDIPLWVEYRDGERWPVALIETAEDRGQFSKPTTVLLNLAKMANLPCYTVLYTLDSELNPAYQLCHDIKKFRVKRLYPLPADITWRILTPKEWAEELLIIRGLGAKQVNERLFPQLIEEARRKELF